VPIVPSPPLADVHQRDDGFWSIGFHDEAAGPFESRRFAEAVALAVNNSTRRSAPANKGELK
jgi:hypothetical protein